MIDARSLHKWLGSQRQFANWFAYRVNEYGFEEGTDYSPNKIVKRTTRGGNNRMDYLITIDMAKELAMVERTDKGRETRR